MLKFYILVSNPSGFFRHFSPHYSNLAPEKVEVVINTQNEDYKRDLVYLCKIFNVVYHITESNGTPAKGKNSLLEIFQSSNNDYCVQIDGDDYITPHGVWLFEKVASSKSVPDVICLKNQISRCHTGKMFSKNYKPELRHFFTMSGEEVDYSGLKEDMRSQHLSDEKIDTFVEYHKKYHYLQGKYCEDRENHSRVVFFSKKAAEYRFPEEFVVGEDTIMYYLLKNAHFERKLNMVCNDEAPATYIYDQLISQGTVWMHSKGFTDLSWMSDFNIYVEQMETQGLLHERDVPLLKIKYEEGCVLDDLKTAGLVRFERDGRYVALPANAAKETVLFHLDNHSLSMEK